MKAEQFTRDGNDGFNFFYERVIKPGEIVYVKMPRVTANRRGINDICWQTDGDSLILYGTLFKNPFAPAAIWDQIMPNDDVNKTVSCVKAVNSGDTCRLLIRVIMN